MRKFPYVSLAVLVVIVAACVISPLIAPGNANYMDLTSVNQAPSAEHLFGTDKYGRDLWSIIWHGGRISLYIGAVATLVATAIAIIYGSLSGFSNRYIDAGLMRGSEIFLSIPSILLVIVLQAVVGAPTPTSIALVIGFTSWMVMAKVIRTEVRQIVGSDYVLASKAMGARLPFITRVHLIPNAVPAIMFMVVMNVSTAIGTEATLSFLGIGLPLNQVSWGSAMAASQNALLTNSWWIIVVPGFFLVATIFAITNVAEYIRQKGDRNFSGLNERV